MTASAPSFAARQAPDRDFGSNGKVLTGFGSAPDSSQGRASVRGVADSGHFYVSATGGSRRSVRTMHRFDPDGRLDRRFERLSHRVGSKVYSSTVLPDGRLLVGRVGSITAYLPTGKVDRSFGKRGSIKMKGQLADSMLPLGKNSFVAGQSLYGFVGGAVVRYSNSGRRLSASSVSANDVRVDDVSPEGEATVVGFTYYEDGDSSDALFLMNAKGKVREIKTAEFPEFALVEEVAFRGDGYLLTTNREGTSALDSRGRIDRTFGDDGVLYCPTTDPPTRWYVRRAQVQPDGGIVGIAARDEGCRGPVGFSPDGKVDPAYGTGGIAAHPEFQMDQVTLDRSGGTLVAGWSPDRGGPAVARYSRDGRRDLGFGLDGTASAPVPIPDVDRSFDSAVQKDGKLVVGGSSKCARGDCQDFALARYRPDGSLDPAFGDGGTVEVDHGEVDQVNAVAIQTDGRILAAGVTDGKAMVMRLGRTGRLDPTFGDGGFMVADTAGISGAAAFNDIESRRDGSAVMVGTVACPGMDCTDWLLARVTSDGTLDTSFRGSGAFRLDAGGLGPGGYGDEQGPDYDAGRRLVALKSGKILVAGDSGLPGGYSHILVTRLKANGRVDRSFGHRGETKVRVYRKLRGYGPEDALNTGHPITGMAVGRGGRIVISAGHEYSVPSRYSTEEFNSGALLALKPNGIQDLRFGTVRGSVVNPKLAIRDLAFDRCGRILVGGTLGIGKIGDSFALARYSRSGRLDRSFGNPAYRIPAVGSADSFANALKLGAAGRVFLTGWSSTARDGDQFAVAAMRMSRDAFRCAR